MSTPQSPYQASPYGGGGAAPSGQAAPYPPTYQGQHGTTAPPAPRAGPYAPPPTQAPQQPYPGHYPAYPTDAYAAPQQQQQQQRQQPPQRPAYPPSFSPYSDNGHHTAAGAPPAAAASSSTAAAAPAAHPAPVYPSYPTYGAQPEAPVAPMAPPPPPHAFIPREATREEVVDEAIAATSQHWVNTQLRRETERRYEQKYGTKPPVLDDGASRDDGYLGENLPRRNSSGGGSAGVAPAGSPFGPRKHVEFHVGSPRHVVRLALLLFAALFGVLPLMSAFSFTVLLCGVVLVYISDYLGYHRSTVFILIGSAAVFALSMLLSNFHAAITSFGPMLMIADIGVLLVVVVAATLQHFRWVQETFPNVLVALERLVFALGPVAALPPLLATTTALTGSRYAPFFFFLVVCTLHNYFYCPLMSSFLVVVAGTPGGEAGGDGDTQVVQDAAAGGVHARRKEMAEQTHVPAAAAAAPAPGHEVKVDDDDVSSQSSTASSYGAPMQLNEQAEALIFSCLVVILPVAVYNSFQSNWPDHVLANVLNSLGLVCGGVAYFCVSPVHSLWFLASPPDSTYSLAQQLEYDPLGLMDLVGVYRLPLLTAVVLTGVHWGVYRVLTSRYAYLFAGLPFPFNAIVLLIALYVAAYVAIEIKKLIDVDSRGGDVTKGKYLARRAPVLLGTCVSVMLLCGLGSVPGVFLFPCVLSVMAFNLFLTDRTNGSPMFSFTVFTSLLLLWWMYRTFSFIVVDLRVFGEMAVVPTPMVAVSVLWCYVLGCMSFTMAFSPNKTPLTIMLFLLALQLTFVEHVLYSQKEEGVYPALLVAFTSAVGMAVPCRMYANGVLPVESAALIASCYVAKFYTFLVEVTSAYYAAELDVEDDWQTTRSVLLVMEITGGWWVALFASYYVAIFEIQQRRRMKLDAARRVVYSYTACAAVLSLLTVRNVQRAAYEFVTQSYVSEQELPHIAAGTCCLTFALLTLPVWWRLQPRYLFISPLRTVSRWVAALAVVLLAVQPTRVAEESVSDFDYDFEYADLGRYAAAVGLLMLIAARLSFMVRLPAPARVVWWLVAAAALALGITGLVQAAPSFIFYLLMLGLVFTMLLLVDVAHYREVSGTALFVVYGVSVLLIPLSFLQFNRAIAAQQERVRYDPDRIATLWDMYEQGSMRLLAVIVVVHMGLAALLNCRLSGRPLLPRCKEMGHDAAMSLGVVLNFSTELAVALLCAVNFYGNDSEPALYVLSSLFLLLFVNDEVMFFGLREHNFRYFPPAACAFALLWACTIWNAWQMGAASLSAMSQLQWIVYALSQAALTLPAQVSLLVLLWRGRKMGSSPGFVVVGSVVLNVVCLLFVSSKPIQWMAIVGILGQCARFFDNQLRPTPGSRRRRQGVL